MTVIPYPVSETLVVCPVRDGVAQTEVLHEPAERFGGFTLKTRLSMNNGIPPYEWASKCGHVGVVYVRDGLLANVPMCDGCALPATPALPKVKAPPVPRQPTSAHGLHGYWRGCRCPECTTGNREYMRGYMKKKRAA